MNFYPELTAHDKTEFKQLARLMNKNKVNIDKQNNKPFKPYNK